MSPNDATSALERWCAKFKVFRQTYPTLAATLVVFSYTASVVAILSIVGFTAYYASGSGEAGGTAAFVCGILLPLFYFAVDAVRDSWTASDKRLQ